jgi:histidinol dehydrogenase
MGPDAEALAPRIRTAGALFVGRESGTAFGDYVAGSNHTLPTGGAARFASQLGPRHFRRRMSEVRIGPAAAALARAAAPIARAEGFVRHAASMEVRENGGG